METLCGGSVVAAVLTDCVPPVRKVRVRMGHPHPAKSGFQLKRERALASQARSRFLPFGFAQGRNDNFF
jgi:hypothetical protein